MTSKKERLPTISMACVSSFGFLMAILAGTNPEFIKITAVDGDVLVNTDGDELEISQTGLGVVSSTQFSTDNDSLWGLSRIFFYISIVLGLFTTILAIALASNKVEATTTKWRNLSIGSAMTALCSVPVFLIFEAIPCTEFEFQQFCVFSTGSHLQIVGTLCWVTGVAITQCLEPRLELSKKEDRELPANPTDSNSVPSDEEQGSSPRSATPPIGDALPVKVPEEEKKEDEPEFESFAGSFNAFKEDKQKSEQASPAKDGFQPMGPITVTPEKDNENEVSKYPAYQEDPLQERTPFQSKNMTKSENEKDQPLSNFANFDNFDDTPPPPPSESKKEKFNATMMKIMPISPQKKMANKLSNLKNSLSGFQRSSFGVPGRKSSQVYDQMLEDDMSSKGSIYNPVAVAMRGDNMSVRSAALSSEDDFSIVSKTMSQIAHEKSLLDDWNELHAATNAQHEPPLPPPPEQQVVQRHIQLDDEHKGGDDWHALHMAMTAGVRMGLIEGMSGTEDPYEVASYHSDPEPVLYSSDDDDDEEDNIELGLPRSIIPDDNSTISSHSTTSVVRTHTKSRRSLRSSRRLLRTDLSVSLLSLTIDEETVEDILEETSEDDLQNPYSLVRTVSEPLPQRTAPAIEVSLSSRGRRPLAGGDAGSIKTAKPTIRPNFGKKQSPVRKDPLDLGMAASPYKDPLDLGAAASPYKDPLDLGTAPNPYSPYNDPLDRDPLEQMEDEVNSDDKTAPRENADVRARQQKAENAPVPRATATPPKPFSTTPSKPASTRQAKTPPRTMASSSPMYARRLRAMARDDSSSSDSDGGVLDKRARARALRMQRLKNQSLNASNSTDETDLNTSYASKYSTGSSLPSPAKSQPSPTKSYPSPPIQRKTSEHFKEEKKEDDQSESGARVVTPDSKKDTTFEGDDMNVDGIEIIMPKSLQGKPAVSPTIGGDNVSVITPHHEIHSSDSDEDRMQVDYVKAGAEKVRERILNRFSFSERSQASKNSNASSDHSQKYGSHVMDHIDLQLIHAGRPQGVEYGEEEMSL